MVHEMMGIGACGVGLVAFFLGEQQIASVWFAAAVVIAANIVLAAGW